MLAPTVSELKTFGKIPESEDSALLQGFLDTAISQIEKMTGRLAADLDSPESREACLLLALASYQGRDFPSQPVNEAVRARVIQLVGADIDIEKTLIYSKPPESP